MAPSPISPAVSANNNPAFAYAISLLPPGIELPSFEAMKARDDVKATVVRVNVVFLSLVGLTCACRCYVRLWMVRNFGWDDACMILACACATVLSAMCLESVNHGLGQHIWMVPLLRVIPMTMRVVKNLIVCALTYSSGMTFAKLSIILSYHRLFPVPRFRLFLHLLGATILALWFCTIWIVLFQCKPISGAWDFTITSRKCIPVVRYFYFAGGVNIFTDVALCTVPLPFLLRMRLPRRQKGGVCVLFVLGGFACVASTLRLGQLHNLISVDITYTSVSSLNWSVVETGTSIVCASFPSLKPLWILLMPRCLRSAKEAAPSGAGGGAGAKGYTPTSWGSGRSGGHRKLSKGTEGSSVSGSRGGDDAVAWGPPPRPGEEVPMQDICDEERGIKKTVAMTMTVDVTPELPPRRSSLNRGAGRRYRGGAEPPHPALVVPEVVSVAYSSQEPMREARTTWVDSAEELVTVVVPHPDMGIVRQASRQGGGGGTPGSASRQGRRKERLAYGGVLIPRSMYAR